MYFYKTRQGYITKLPGEFKPWPIHTRIRHNGSWQATILRPHTKEVIFQEIGLTRIGVATEALEWLTDNAQNLYLSDVMTQIETEAVAKMIHEDDNKMLSAWMNQDARILRDEDGDFVGIEVDASVAIEDEEDDDEDE